MTACPKTFAGLTGWGLFLVLSSPLAVATGYEGQWGQSLRDGTEARELGNLDDSIAALEQAVQQAPDAAGRERARTELGLSLAQTGRLNDARAALETAYREAPSDTRYTVALALGNLALRSQDSSQADLYYREVIASAPEDRAGADAKVAAGLNLLWLQSPLQRLAGLEQLLPQIDAMSGTSLRARADFSAGMLASDALERARLTHSPQFDYALRLSYRRLQASRDWAQQSGDAALAVDAADALAQLYESQDRLPEAERLDREAAAAAASLKQGQADLPLARLDWRAGRLAQRRGETSLALASYLRAARHLEAIRQDLPIADARGNSTYLTLQRPVFAGVADLLLKDVDGLAPDAQQTRLATVLSLTEQAHQAELQDYLGDRCSVDSVRAADTESVPPGVAVVYPIVLKDRLEVVVRTSHGLLHHAAPVSAAALASAIQSFRAALLDTSSSDYLQTAQRLHEWLIAPFAGALMQANVRSLVIVPDGYLRLIPFGALHDGTQFLAQRYWVSMATGLSMTERDVQHHRKAVSLFVGLSAPGPVVYRLLAMGFTGGSSPATSPETRGLENSVDGSEPPPSSATRELSLRSQLALPGVQTEIEDLVPLTRSVWLLNDQFTVDRFAREVQSGHYTVVHIASHSFLGSNAGESFLIAYDNVIRIDQLQQLIAANDSPQTGIDLLTLSACDTATGDERAPLGFAGAAIKARAGSVLGSLWPVNDSATQDFMELFYRGLPQHTKTEAFTDAQRQLIQSTRFSHPYYWAPFILTGDWN